MTVRIIPDELYYKIRENLDDKAVVLISESSAEELGLTEDNKDDVTYDFGGDADVWVDFVSSEDHLFIVNAKEQGVIK